MTRTNDVPSYAALLVLVLLYERMHFAEKLGIAHSVQFSGRAA